MTVYEGAINPKVLTEEQLLLKQEPQEEKQKSWRNCRRSNSEWKRFRNE